MREGGDHAASKPAPSRRSYHNEYTSTHARGTHARCAAAYLTRDRRPVVAWCAPCISPDHACAHVPTHMRTHTGEDTCVSTYAGGRVYMCTYTHTHTMPV